ncbi:MAG: hypothetical protein U5K51_03745 [Flavobacteriaceae bacterium]|nr:hypothetical protein [Flavobacteriaceae bacterium]
MKNDLSLQKPVVIAHLRTAFGRNLWRFRKRQQYLFYQVLQTNLKKETEKIRKKLSTSP